MTDQELDSMLEKLPEPERPAGGRERFVSRYRQRAAWRGVWKWALAGVALTAVTGAAFTQAEAELSSATYPLADGRMLVARLIARPGAPVAWQWTARLKGDGGMKDGCLQQRLTDRLTGRIFSYRVCLGDAALPMEIHLSKPDGLSVRLSAEGSAPRVTGEFVLAGPRVFLDGVDLGSAGVASLGGVSLELARAGLGRFVLTMDPRGDSRFLPMGAAAGRRIEFRTDNHAWRIECKSDLPKQGVLYVWHDRDYRTAQPLEFGAGGWAPER